MVDDVVSSSLDGQHLQRRHRDREREASDGLVVVVADNPHPLQHHPVARRSHPLPLFETNIPSVCCAILASITTGGTTYAFGLYGDALKKTLHLTQSQLDTISAVFFSAGLLSFIPGAYVDRFGTRLGISIGGVAGAATLMLYWAVSRGFFPHLSTNPNMVVLVLSILGVGIFLSCALVTGSVFKIISCHCGPGSKGSAVGVAKGFVGLGSGAYACIFQSIRRSGTSNLDFLPMCAFFFITAATVPSWIVLPSKYNERTVPDVLTPLHFHVLYTSLVVLAVLIITKSLHDLYEEAATHHHGGGDDIKDADDDSQNYMMAGLILLVWIGPIVALLFLPQRTDFVSVEVITDDDGDGPSVDREDEQREQTESLLFHTAATTGDHGDDLPSSPNLKVSTNNSDPGYRETVVPADEDDSEEEVSVALPVPRQNDKSDERNLFQMMQSSSAWLLLWTCTVLVGGGTVETNNLGQMVESLGFSSIVTPAALALFSVAQSGGRVITGAASEAALQYDTERCCVDRGVPRPFFFVVASAAGVVAHTILALATDEVSFVIGITLSGVAFGMVWPLMVLCVGEIFGKAHFGANYMFFDGFTSAAGTFLLSKMVAQRVYEGHIDPRNGNNDGVTCYGQRCFQQTHIIIVVLSMTCLVTSAVTQYKTRKVYKQHQVVVST